MQPKHFYLGMVCLGAVLPMTQFVPWYLQHGWDAARFGRDLFANRISRFFALDLLLSAVTVVSLALRQRSLRHRWLPVLVTCLVGLSAGLPLLLYLREMQSAGQPETR